MPAKLRRETRAMSAVIGILHLVGVAWLAWVTASGGGTFGIGIGLTAYLLGLRHAFDADHICAIDNAVRKLLDERRPARSVGFWFALGHASVVFAAALVFGIGLDGHRAALARFGGFAGPALSAGFLFAVAAMNLTALVRSVDRRRRGDAFDLRPRGLFSGLLRSVLGSVSKAWHTYAIGLLFGLGFDTLGEVALLVIASSHRGGAPLAGAAVCLPVLFAAGMCLFDTIDGALMTSAYSWALSGTDGRFRYNILVTAASVVAALIVGCVQLGTIDVPQLRPVVIALLSFASIAVMCAVVAGRVHVRRMATARLELTHGVGAAE
jgi:high-affinity nickel-transport protein